MLVGIIRVGSFLGGNIVRPVSSLILEKFLDEFLTIYGLSTALFGRGWGNVFCGGDKLFVIDDGCVTLRVEV